MLSQKPAKTIGQVALTSAEVSIKHLKPLCLHLGFLILLMMQECI